MTKPANLKGIETATNIKWDEWVKFLNDQQGEKLAHKEIAHKAYEKMDKSQASRGWWSQAVAVAYEQHIGRRQPGQNSAGKYDVTVSKTLAGSMDEAMRAWLSLAGRKTEFDGVPVIGKPDISKSEKWRYWRVNLTDGSRIYVATFQKTADKAGLAVTNMKLTSNEAVEQWRSFWKEFLKDL